MIRILWPTIRPKVAVAKILEWRGLMTDKANALFYIGVNSEQDRNAVITPNPEKHKGEGCVGSVKVYENARPGITHTATLMTQHWMTCADDKDVIVLASDDFSCSPGWDEHLCNQYSFEWSGALICNDGYRKDTNIIGFPIVSGACLKRLGGVLYNPHYRHLFSDQELFDICTELQLIKNLRGTPAPLFAHRHWSFGGRQRDSFDQRNSAMEATDRALYEKRKSLPVAEKLKLPEWF